MIHFPAQARCIDELVAELIEPSAKRSWNVVLAPGFDDGWIVEQVRCRLREASPRPYVAVVSADGLHEPSDLVRRIRADWEEVTPLDCNLEGSNPSVLLPALLAAAREDRPRIQIIARFDKILGQLDERVLVALRDAEQAHRIRTVTIASHSYKWIKKYWKAEGKLLHASNYGDSHVLRAPDVSSLDEVRKTLASEAVPDGLVQMAYAWTGGYPGPLRAVIERWRDKGRPPLLPAVQRDLRAEAERRMEPMIRGLDAGGDRRFRGLVIDLHLHRGSVGARGRLEQFHPWGSILVDEDGLRADCLGDAAVTAEIEEAFEANAEREHAGNLLSRARQHYERGEVGVALRLLKGLPSFWMTAEVQLLMLHAQIIEACGGIPGVDSDWPKVSRLIVEVCGALKRCNAGSGVGMVLEGRYDALGKLAGAVIAAEAAGSQRIVDVLGGLRGREELHNHLAAFELLVFQTEIGRRMEGNAVACRAVLPMPEQILRLWALWVVGVNYYEPIPATSEAIWELVEAHWPADVGALARPIAGAAFPNLRVFFYYCHAKHLVEGRDASGPTLNDGFAEVERSLSLLDIRNDFAHAEVRPNSKTRLRYFQQIDAWLKRLAGCAKLPAGALSAALECAKPLPLSR